MNKNNSSTLNRGFLWDYFVAQLKKEHGDNLLYRSKHLSCGSGKMPVWALWVKDPKGERTTFVVNSCLVFIHARKIIDYDQWSEVLETYCLCGRKQVIQGECLRLGGHLGYIRAVTVERNHRKPKVNFDETKKQPKVLRDGKWVPERIILFTDYFYPMIQYVRKGMLKNQKNYKFIPVRGRRGGKGFTGELAMTVRMYPELMDIYPKKTLA